MSDEPEYNCPPRCQKCGVCHRGECKPPSSFAAPTGSPLAEVENYLGRSYLKVAGIPVAMEGDLCRFYEYGDGSLRGTGWTRANLEDAARRINEAANDRTETPPNCGVRKP